LTGGEPVTRFDLYRPNGRLISAIAMTGFQTPALCIHRADLHQALRSQLPEGCLIPGQRVESFEQDTNSVTARFEGEREVRAEGLIAADGINSAVRAQIHRQGEPIF